MTADAYFPFWSSSLQSSAPVGPHAEQIYAPEATLERIDLTQQSARLFFQAVRYVNQTKLLLYLFFEFRKSKVQIFRENLQKFLELQCDSAFSGTSVKMSGQWTSFRYASNSEKGRVPKFLRSECSDSRYTAIAEKISVFFRFLDPFQGLVSCATSSLLGAWPAFLFERLESTVFRKLRALRAKDMLFLRDFEILRVRAT